MPKKTNINNVDSKENTTDKRSMLLEDYISDYISATLARLLAGEELDSLIGSIVNLKSSAAILKVVADYCDKKVRWEERINEVMNDNTIHVEMGDWEQYLQL